jgi:catechol 2,3-dioxygenase-like lactoylglutathione lyase family enzyme
MDPETKTDTNVTQAVPFFHVTDIEASVRFYVDGLGFKMTKRWVDAGKLQWCWLELGDAALMLQAFRTEGHGPQRPEGKLGLGVVISFQCKDALAIFQGAKSRGIDASQPFVGNGMWVTGMDDPDGYRLEFESFTDEPEESVLPE